LYDEIVALNVCLTNGKILKDKPVDKIWVDILNSIICLQLKRIVSITLSVPVSNAFVERIFSIVENIWRNDRNNMRLELVRAEICIRTNFKLNCSEFYNYLTLPEQKELLNAAENPMKYNFKKTKNN
jgi:hypothetical protein